METFSYWHKPLDQLYSSLKSRKEGLTSKEALQGLKEYGFNSIKPPRRGKGIVLFLSQFKSPIILLLIGASILSGFLGDQTDTIIILTIVALSGLLGFIQERGALNALEKLMQMVENKTTVLRDGKEVDISLDQVVPGDVVILRAGDLVPADCIVIDANHFFVNEAMLTGESSPVEKLPGIHPEETSFTKRTNSLFLGTSIVSGLGKGLIINTGLQTEYSRISEKIRFRPPETAFEIGVRKFGAFLLEVTLLLVITIFALNTYFHKPIIESFLFSLALAVGLTPQLLPAIITVNLCHGARRMAKKHVIIKRLASIENFGQMNILCTDKTGTITAGKIHLHQVVGVDAQESPKAALYGFLNAHFQAGYSNPLDSAILNELHFDTQDWKKVDELPFDFNRKRLSILFDHEGKSILITKGALTEVLSVCNRIELGDGSITPIGSKKNDLISYFAKESEQGFRSLAVAYGDGTKESDLIFLGFLHFFDPIKPDITQVVGRLKKQGVSLKIITGDHQFVASYVANAIGIPHTDLITGEELSKISDDALIKVANEKNVFAEIEPNQKERIIIALRKAGYVIGYLGDGINDVSALHSADVGIAVDSGADAAKESADIVLLEKDLSVLSEGIQEGRRTFCNTLKYVYMATSANFGNMFSMAAFSLVLPFLPLLPKQILLTNFFSDLPEMALATDRVDAELILRPVKWDLAFIRRFMLIFGVVSSIPDFLTFGALIYWLGADITLFRSGWFMENIISAALIVLAIRTRKSLFKSRPGKLLVAAVFFVSIGIPFLSYTPLGALFELKPLPMKFYLVLSAIIAFYIVSVEIVKKIFYNKRFHNTIT